MTSQADVLGFGQIGSRRFSLGRFLRRYGAAYLFISPFFILYAFFGLYPILYSFVLSLHD